MRRLIQCTGNMHQIGETRFLPNDLTTDASRIPSLRKIAAQFLSGRPIDASLQRNLGYNDFEGNPFLKKGFDLADLPEVAKDMKMTMDKVNDEIERVKLANTIKKGGQVENPEVTPPSLVESQS